MKKLLLASAASLALASMATAQEVKIGTVVGFTGPLESLAPDMAGGSELAMNEVNASGNFLNGATVVSVRGDSTCIDAAAATAVAERLITSDGVSGIVGADCSGVTNAMLQNVAVPNGMVMVSPSATSPALTTVEDNGLFFRTAPSDARQGVVMTEVIMDRGIKSVAVTYTNNDYGQGLADSFAAAFEAAGGTVTLVAAHEDGRADYSAEVGALAAAGGDALVVAGYVDQGGSGIIRAALDSGAFETFVFPDGMVSSALVENFGSEIDGSFGQHPGTDSEGASIFETLAAEAGFDGTQPFAKESYDAAALIMLAMQAAGSSNPADYAGEIMDIANAPGTPILPGELGKALELIAAGEDIDYVGASAVELIEPGESAGNYREIEISGGEITTARFR
ncbi:MULTISPECIES: ABC transporter substrate-binding protein [Roseobacteraceae]|jgi:branched-chain amino acid transport system substrate-binding protein|uniref:ABC transporter substrate-binding protein n=1 Tax=Roseobacteraceae TaxID=2854170 RepID=UPI00193762A6|nr:ABC transporter substrate-binding protein [Roseovarius sp. 10]MBE1288494.1 ABC transporter substrate-binding protein [Paracoccaceae bacterium]MBF9022854.1 ABC transporter substrate-binding protein [Rhodobacterales bacterium FZCC0069]MBF9053136.1 ABC transporter substrate-binding protein [Rhodobacterales bacterium LSUCC1028]MBF9055046.1 ABC transporter substrate-binding protein [Rhodobacterales bacterium HKCCA1065]QPI85968.1 ABC transporter substrate-binding protein [Rhodobacterales bacteriu